MEKWAVLSVFTKRVILVDPEMSPIIPSNRKCTCWIFTHTWHLLLNMNTGNFSGVINTIKTKTNCVKALDTNSEVKSVQSTLSHLITTSVSRAMFTHFLVEHGWSQYFLYWIDLPRGWITWSDEYFRPFDLQSYNISVITVNEVAAKCE